jgi:hypothetical protein
MHLYFQFVNAIFTLSCLHGLIQAVCMMIHVVCMMIHVVCQIPYSPVQSLLLNVHDDTCSVPDTVQYSQFCLVCMMTHEVYQILYSPVSSAGCAWWHMKCARYCTVQSVLLGVHDATWGVPDTVQYSQFCWVCMMTHEVCQILCSPVQSVTLCVQDDTCSVSVTVQSSTVSSAGCACPYVNIKSKTGRWVGCIVQCSLIGQVHYITIQVYLLYVEGSTCKFAGCYVIRGGVLRQCNHTHTHTGFSLLLTTILSVIKMLMTLVTC